VTRTATGVGPNAYFGPYLTTDELEANFPAADNPGRRAFIGGANPPWATYESVANVWTFMSATPLSNLQPTSEAVSATIGSSVMAARADHAHQRLTSSTRVTLDASGLATVTYTRTFSAPPVLSCLAINPTGRPVTVEQVSDIKTGALWTGAQIHGYRTQNLPAVITLLSGLINYDVFGASAAGVDVNVIAIQPSN
jgi:hypothetical protein